MTTTTGVEDGVLAVLETLRSAHAARDAHSIIGLYAETAVRYTLAPPLQQEYGTEYGDAEGLQKWLDTFDGPVHIEHRDPQVTVSGDLALVHALTRMTATPAGAPESFSFWYRCTFRLRGIDGVWRIVHQHDSTPFHMDGSFRAAVDLEPPARGSRGTASRAASRSCV
jgi:ketosteroid isomerase-like protein